MSIDQKAIELIRPDGFDKNFSIELQKHDTYEQAFNALNRLYEKQFGYKRYANYESYRISRANRLKK